eukprot:s636_g5.t1
MIGCLYYTKPRIAVSLPKMSSGMPCEIAGLNEDRFVYVQALLIGRTVRVRTAGEAVYEGLFHSCSQDQSSSIVLQDAREQKNGQNRGEVIPTLIIAGSEVESLQAYNVPMECELFGAPGSERLHISEPVPGSHAIEPVPQDASMAEYTQDSVTTMDPNLIPQKQREEAERLAREIEAGRHPASGGGALAQMQAQAVAELPRPDFGGRPGRSDLLRVKTARKDGIWRQPTAGRGLNAMNLELPMRGVNHETRSQPDVETNNENQVTERALHQLKELQNVQGPAATRQVLLRQHYRCYEARDVAESPGTPPPEEGGKRHSMKGLRPLGLLEPVPRVGREEPIMAGPVVPGLATGSNVAAQAGWGKNVDMVALTKSINSLNLEPGPPKPNEALQLLHMPDEEPIGAERSDTPESQMMPVFHPKAPEEQMEMLQEQQQQLQQQMQQQQQQQQQLQQQMQQQQQLQQQQLLQMQQLSPQQLQQLQMQLQQQIPLQNQTSCNNQMQNDQPLQRMLLNASATASYMAQTEVDRRKAAGSLEGRKDGTPSTPSSLGQPLQPGQQPSRAEEGKQRRASKELATPLSLSEELPQLLKVGRQRGGGRGAANERREFFHRTNTPSNDEGEPAGLPLQMRVEHRSELPVDQEQGPLEPGLMKREEEKMPQFQCGAGSPLTTGMVITRFFDQASKEQAVNSPVQWPQAIGGSYKNILTEQLQSSSPSQGGMPKAPQVPDLPQVPMQHEVPQAPAPQVPSQQMPMRQSGGGAANQQQAMNRPSPMLPGPMSNDSAANWQSPGTPAGTQGMTRSPQGTGGEVDTQGQKGGKREKRGRKAQKERASRPENTAGASGPSPSGPGHSAPNAPSVPSGPAGPAGPTGPAGPAGPGGCAQLGASACATAAAPGNCGGCGNCGMPCQPCGCAMMGGCCGGCCVLGCGGGGDGSCGLGSNPSNRTTPGGGCGCGACGQLAAAGGQLGGCAACSGPGPCGPCGCGGCNQMGQMGNAMACGG